MQSDIFCLNVQSNLSFTLNFSFIACNAIFRLPAPPTLAKTLAIKSKLIMWLDNSKIRLVLQATTPWPKLSRIYDIYLLKSLLFEKLFWYIKDLFKINLFASLELDFYFHFFISELECMMHFYSMIQSFWQKNSLITNKLFELCLFAYLAQPSPNNYGTPSIQWY